MANKKKKGFSLVEVAIALAIVVIVTVTALTIVLNSIAPKINNNNRSHAQNFAHNAWQCFQVTNSVGEFKNALSAAYDPSDINRTQFNEEGGYEVYTYTSKEHKYTAEITLLFPNETNGVTRPTMSLRIVNEKDEEIIQVDKYERGAGV